MKKCAVINDISGFGKCSLTAAIPIMNAKGVQVNPLVTGVFSNQTGYNSFCHRDLTDMIPSVTREWKKLSCTFDGILTGFLLSDKQYRYIINFLDEFKTRDTLLVVDPIMGDDGSVYATFTNGMVEGVKKLCERADIITPNLTELRILSDERDIVTAGEKLINSGIKAVVATGIIENDTISNYVFYGNEFRKFDLPFIEHGEHKGSFSGTGDIFSAFITADILNGKSIFDAVESAGQFIYKAIKSSKIANRNDGIDFEKYLIDLR